MKKKSVVVCVVKIIMHIIIINVSTNIMYDDIYDVQTYVMYVSQIIMYVNNTIRLRKNNLLQSQQI